MLPQQPWIWPAISCTVVLACILVANPFNEVGFCDDWSYGSVAMTLARTGRLQYNGWGSPLVLFQSFWAVPWLRVFGFSSQVLQASMVPISLGFVLMIYAVGRQIGLPPALAAFASMATGTSPLFLPLAASFMTDACGCFFAMLCIYLALRGAYAEGPAAARWSWWLALVGTVGGANRQIVWIAPLTLIPYLGWVHRRSSRLRAHAVAAWLVCVASILVVIYFFGQPYGPLQLHSGQILWLLRNQWATSTKLFVSLVLVYVLVSIPVLFCFLPLTSYRSPKLLLILIASSLCAFTQLALTGLLAPYGTNILSPSGVTTGTQEFFGKPQLQPLWARLFLSVLVNSCILTVFVKAGRNWTGPDGTAGRLRQDRSLHVFGIFSAGYLVLLFPGVLSQLAFDRYMLPLIPLLMLTALPYFSRFKRPIPVVAWACLALFAAYGIAATHDYFAAERTRTIAAEQLEKSGIRRDLISAGFEYDGWTQVERSGYVRAAQYGDWQVDDSDKGFWFEFWSHTPDFRPDFVVLNSYSGEFVRRGLFQINFCAWIPPFRRSAVVWRRSDLKAGEYLPH